MLGRGLCWGLVVQYAVRSILVVVSAPSSGQDTRMQQARKPFVIQELIPEASFKALDESILRGFARLNQLELNAMLACPLVKSLACKFRPLASLDFRCRPTQIPAAAPEPRPFQLGQYSRDGQDTGGEAADRLLAYPPGFGHAERLGCLKNLGSQVSREELERFQQNHVLGKEIAAIFGCSSKKMSLMLAVQGIYPLRGEGHTPCRMLIYTRDSELQRFLILVTRSDLGEFRVVGFLISAVNIQ